MAEEQMRREPRKFFLQRWSDEKVERHFDPRTNPNIANISRAFWGWGFPVYRSLAEKQEWIMLETSGLPLIMKILHLFEQEMDGPVWAAFPGAKDLFAPFPLVKDYSRKNLEKLANDFAAWMETSNFTNIELVSRPDFRFRRHNESERKKLEPVYTGYSLLSILARGLSTWGIPTSLAEEEDWLKVPIEYSPELMAVILAWSDKGLPEYKRKGVLNRGHFIILPHDEDFVLPYPAEYIDYSEKSLTAQSLAEWLFWLSGSFDWSLYETE